MFGLGIWEIALILAVALVVLGPQKLPSVAKQLGRGLRELRRAASDFQVTLEQEADAEEMRSRQKTLQSAPPGTVASPVGEPIDEDLSQAEEPAAQRAPADAERETQTGEGAEAADDGSPSKGQA